MAFSDEPGSGRKCKRASGHEYTDVRISNHARVHLGDTYHLGLNDPIARLPRADDAAFNSLTKQFESTCHADTRVELLKEIHSWADRQDSRCIFWLRGLAGTGKSTIARTIARRYHDEQRLAASFFFSRGGGDVGQAGKFVTSIAVQLADNVPASRQHIREAIAERSNIARQSLRDQWRHLVLRPLSKLYKSGQEAETHIIVVDALDECEGDNNIRIIMQLLAEAQPAVGPWLRVLLTSRPEVPIRNGFYTIADAEHQDFVLHNISTSIVDHDISIYLEYTLRLFGVQCGQTADWPGAEIIAQLVQSASGLFIWAATACRFIQQGGQFFANDRLQALFKDSRFTNDLPTDESSNEDSDTDDSRAILPNMRLNGMYLTVLQGPIRNYTSKEKKKWYAVIKEMLGAIILLFSPLSAPSLAKLLHVSAQTVHQTLSELHSILDVPKDHGRPLRLHHPSFRDFLLDRGRCGNAFWVDEQQAHAALADCCMRIMSTSLKQDVCDVGAPGALAAEVGVAHLEQCLSAEVQYACVYWIQHLAKSGGQLCDGDTVHTFLTEHCLHWLEALGWLSKVSEGIHAISLLESITLGSACPNLYAFVHDMKRFALYIRPAIEQAPLQVYYSGLVFAPSGSIVRKQFAGKIPGWMKMLPKVDSGWGAVMQTLEGHSDLVNAVAFSPDGKVVASASDDKTVKLWDAGTGAAMQTLEGHSGLVNAMAFSPDGKVVASASGDETVKLWDAGTGAAMQTLEGHSNWVNAVAFSPDGKVVASASYDNTVKLWDAGTGAAMQMLEGHSHWINEVAFSPDGKVVASASHDKTVKLWDAGTGAAMQTPEGHSHWINEVAFSPDGKVVASASHDKTVKLWDAGTGAAIQTLKGHSSWVNAVAFSPDGKVVASASYDKTVKLWDAGTDAAMQTLEGHLNEVMVVAFSPDGKVVASASHDKTVKLWDAGTGAAMQTLKGHSSWVNAVAFSPDGKVVASASDDQTVKLWDAGTGAAIQTLEGHLNEVMVVAFSPDGKVVASASNDNTVKLWDAGTGAAMQTYACDTPVRSLSFSDDGVLHADRGTICDTTCSTRIETQQNSLPGIFVDQQWISCGSHKLLWLPPEYRGALVAVHEGVVALGKQSGCLSLLAVAL